MIPEHPLAPHAEAHPCCCGSSVHVADSTTAGPTYMISAILDGGRELIVGMAMAMAMAMVVTGLSVNCCCRCRCRCCRCCHSDSEFPPTKSHTSALQAFTAPSEFYPTAATSGRTHSRILTVVSVIPFKPFFSHGPSSRILYVLDMYHPLAQ